MQESSIFIFLYKILAMRNISLSLLVVLLTITTAFSQLNYSEDIAPIVYKNCANCHRQGEIGPFPLTNYEEVSNWGDMIKFVTETRYMPPWKPDTEYSTFLGEATLTDDEIATIAKWVDNGMDRGDASLEPEFPDFPDGSLLGEPDLVLSMAEAHLHEGNNRDSYYYFVLPTNLPEDKIVKSVEFRPSNKEIVHHALIFEDTEGVARATDARTPEYGFESFGGFNGNNNDLSFIEEKQFPPYAPGQKAIFYPDGLGQVLKAGADIAVQIHYAPIPTDEWDQSSINFFFADEDEEVDRLVEQDIMLPFNLPGSFFAFFIPPNEEKEFLGQWVMTEDISMMGIFPHSHLLGKEWEAWIEHTDGSITNLISIPEWDFNWQSQYYFNRYIKAERGAIIKARAVYDNTSNNPNNPNFPPQTVAWGDRTTDEMYYMPFLYVPYRAGDEDILFEEQTTSTQDILGHASGFSLSPISPNPVEDYVSFDFNVGSGRALDITIYNIQGQQVRSLRQGEYFHTGNHKLHFRSDLLEAGTYILNVRGREVNMSQKFVKVN